MINQDAPFALYYLTMWNAGQLAKEYVKRHFPDITGKVQENSMIRGDLRPEYRMQIWCFDCLIYAGYKGDEQMELLSVTEKKY